MINNISCGQWGCIVKAGELLQVARIRLILPARIPHMMCNIVKGFQMT